MIQGLQAATENDKYQVTTTAGTPMLPRVAAFRLTGVSRTESSDPSAGAVEQALYRQLASGGRSLSMVAWTMAWAVSK